MENETAESLREKARAHRERSRQSFERCDTDGFLSQWGNDITARELEKQADILDNNGRARFTGLYEGARRVAAKQITVNPAPGVRRTVWFLHVNEQARYGRRFIPVGKRSRVQKQLVLSERTEYAPAWAKIDVPDGQKKTGLSGCANAQIMIYRTGDEWGRDARPAWMHEIKE